MENNFLNLCSKRFDADFDEIALLERYPWVGINYSSSDCRVLIIGDSHYAIDGSGNFSQESYDDFKSDKYSTRGIVTCAIEDSNSWSMFNGLHRLFQADGLDDRISFWSNVAFYNFIQEPMRSINQQPSLEHFAVAWRCLPYIIDIFKPGFCLFIGKRAWMSNSSIKQEGGSCNLYDDSNCVIDRCIPWLAEITTKKGNKVNAIAIHHTSRYFSHNKWNAYLKTREPEVMSYLMKEKC